MDKKEILSTMSRSEGKRVELIDVKKKEIKGTVFLFESRYDNEDDEDCPGEASICVDCDNKAVCMLYESDIESITVVG